MVSSETRWMMKTIDQIITKDNVYVNWQKYKDPALIDYILEDKSQWYPFLNEKLRKKYFPNGIIA